jgi:hypothetical protein
MDKELESGRSAGGYARAAKLTADERSAIAKKGAAKRWANVQAASDDAPRLLESFKGKIELAGASIPCAVVMGPEGVQRVLSETGLTNAVLGDRSGASKRLKKATADSGAPLPIFLAPRQLRPFISKEMLDGPLKPIDYLDGTRLVRGYDASILAAVCNVWLKAREAGALQEQQLDKALKAEILIRALAETGIIALVDEATLYEKAGLKMRCSPTLSLSSDESLPFGRKNSPMNFMKTSTGSKAGSGRA